MLKVLSALLWWRRQRRLRGVREATVSVVAEAGHVSVVILPEDVRIMEAIAGDAEQWDVSVRAHMAFVRPLRAGGRSNVLLLTDTAGVVPLVVVEASHGAATRPVDSVMRIEAPVSWVVDKARLEEAMAGERPASEVRIGRIKATIWANVSDEGTTFHSVQLSRLYRAGDEWQQSASLGRDDLLVAAKVLDRAHTRILMLQEGAGERSPEDNAGERSPKEDAAAEAEE